MLGGLVSYIYTDGRSKPDDYVVTIGSERVKELLEAGAPIEVVAGHELVGLKVKKPKPEAPKPEPVTAPEGEDRDGWPDGYTYMKRGAYVAVQGPDGPVLSDTPSGKFKGENAAQEAAWTHKGGQE